MDFYRMKTKLYLEASFFYCVSKEGVENNIKMYYTVTVLTSHLGSLFVDRIALNFMNPNERLIKYSNIHLVPLVSFIHWYTIQAQLALSMCKPLGPVPLLQLKSAGVLKLPISLAIESSTVMDKAYLFRHM